MSSVALSEVAVPGEGAAASDDQLGELLARLRYRVLGVELHDLGLGERQRRAAEPTLYHLVAGSVCVVTEPIGADSGACMLLRPGDVVLVPAARDQMVAAVADSQLLVVPLRAGPQPVDAAFAAAYGLAADPAAAIVGGLPDLIANCAEGRRRPVLTALLEGLRDERASDRSDAVSLAAGLAALVVAAVIREWAEDGCAANPSGRAWELAVRDPHIARAVEAMHDDPGAKWSVADLARLANASRSVFAEQFHAAVGEPPLRYLARVRMQRAKQLLGQQGWSVGQTAAALGYCSDVAFSRAFRRVAGKSPSAWRRGR